MSKVAYELRAEYEDTGFGGVLAYGPDRHSFDVAENLDAGGGKIVTDDHLLIAALDQYPALKRTTAGDAPLTALPGVPEEQQPEGAVTPDDAAEIAALKEEYDAENRDVLYKEAEKRKLDLPKTATKPEIIDALVADDRKED